MNAKEWADSMADIFEKLKNGEISIQAATVASKMSNSAGQQMSLQLKYHEMRGEKPELDYFKE